MTRALSLLLLAACLLTSCSLGFRSDWKQAVGQGGRSDLEGAWHGTWHSETTGHRGRLRCVVGPALNAQGDHTFHYHATWAGFLSGAYRATHRVSGQAPEWTFQGQHDMPGWAGGRYTYQGTVQGDTFSACYRCAKDRGTFRMTRVK